MSIGLLRAESVLQRWGGLKGERMRASIHHCILPWNAGSNLRCVLLRLGVNCSLHAVYNVMYLCYQQPIDAANVRDSIVDVGMFVANLPYGRT